MESYIPDVIRPLAPHGAPGNEGPEDSRTEAQRIFYDIQNTVFAMAPATPSLTSLPGKGLVTDPRHWKHPDANNAAHAAMCARWLQAERTRRDRAVTVDAAAELDARARQPRNTRIKRKRTQTYVRGKRIEVPVLDVRAPGRTAVEAGVFCISATKCLRSR